MKKSILLCLILFMVFSVFAAGCNNNSDGFFSDTQSGTEQGSSGNTASPDEDDSSSGTEQDSSGDTASPDENDSSSSADSSFDGPYTDNH